MKKQNENHLYNHETKMIHDIKNIINYTEWSAMRMTALLIYQKKRKNTFQRHQKTTEKKKKQDEQLEMLKEQRYLIK